jgi:hypothetical protein
MVGISMRSKQRPGARAQDQRPGAAWDWQVGPDIFLFIKIFKRPHFDIQIGDLLDVQISWNVS